MNGGELRTKRMLLGFSISSFAEYCGVYERTIRRWEVMEDEIPQRGAEAINKLWNKTIEKAKKEAKKKKNPLKVLKRSDCGKDWSQDTAFVGLVAFLQGVKFDKNPEIVWE